jgi:hypothetical protein
MNKDYSKGVVEIKLHNSFALVTMKSPEDLEEFMSKYANFCIFNIPQFLCSYYKDKQQLLKENFLYDPLSMFSHVKDMSIHNPDIKPVILKDENQTLDDLASIVYQKAEVNHPK